MSKQKFDVEAELSYRRPMEVDTIYAYRKRMLGSVGWSNYPVCPRCNITMEREYQSFCDRCGQKLDWKKFKQATIIKKM